MAIRDRGKLKWQSAFFIPEQVKMLQEIEIDANKIEKPVLDEHQIEQFEQVVYLAMEYTYRMKIKIWESEVYKIYCGLLHRLDEINKILYLGQEEHIIKIRYNDIVSVELAE